MKLWKADPHQYGEGKTHLIDLEFEHKTYCGKETALFPGKSVTTGTANCKVCIQGAENRKKYKQYQIEAEQRRVEIQQQREQDRIARYEFYTAHIRSSKWAELRQRIFKRSDGICEGCGIAKATQVHHTSYDNLGDEFLWELQAICNACHERFHETQRAARQ